MTYYKIENIELPQIEKFSNPLTKKLISSVEKADRFESALTNDVFLLEGMSSIKVRCLLNNLCADSTARYLEVGSWKGSTLISALYNNNVEYHAAIESFGECGDQAQEIEHALQSNCQRILGKLPNHIKKDSFQVDTALEGISNINVYFYDGCHSREATRLGITHYYDCLADNFILLIDDWNRAAVATGALEGIAETGLKMEFVRILPANGDGDVENWWSGLFVASCTKK